LNITRALSRQPPPGPLYLIAQAEGVFDTTGVFAGITVLSAGVLMVGIAVDRLERRLLQGKPERADASNPSGA
jgi:ABC-type nitrate/sulfonate/bicarbonate transport system permease component